uniref:Uncharacterized protein n=1 Tax=Babesia bovis TaxID=5865 RepID=S6BFL4_BABBO|nr:hypothetical protein [Babesia bovis]
MLLKTRANLGYLLPYTMVKIMTRRAGIQLRDEFHETTHRLRRHGNYIIKYK